MTKTIKVAIENKSNNNHNHNRVPMTFELEVKFGANLRMTTTEKKIFVLDVNVIKAHYIGFY